jgi:hypothetical protein
VTNSQHGPKIDLQEVATRNQTARDILTGFATSAPTLARFWQQIDTALTDTPNLATHLTHLAADLATTRVDRANLAAAGLATLAAHDDGEPNPLAYLRDELRAQGYLIAWGRA